MKYTNRMASTLVDAHSNQNLGKLSKLTCKISPYDSRWKWTKKTHPWRFKTMDSRGTSRKTIHGSHNDRKTQRRTNNPMCNRRPSLSTRTLVPVVPRYSNWGGLRRRTGGGWRSLCLQFFNACDVRFYLVHITWDVLMPYSMSFRVILLNLWNR